MNRWIFLLPALIFTLLVPDIGAAHSVHVFAYVEDGEIRGEGSLAGGRKVKNGKVKIIRQSDEQLLLNIITDENGQFAFPVDQLDQPEPADLIIVLDAGPGHRSQWHLSAADYTSNAAAEKDTDAVQPPQKPIVKNQIPPYPPLKNIITGIICIIGLGALIAWARNRRGQK